MDGNTIMTTAKGDMTVGVYTDWMRTRSNKFNCSECPENCGIRNRTGNPCGQQNCWVVCHINQLGAIGE